MAQHKIYLSDVVEKTKLGNSMSTSYSYDGETLTIYWNRGKKVERPAELGDAFIVTCNGKLPKLQRLRSPFQKVDKIAWILGFSRDTRTYSYEDYKQLLIENERRNKGTGYRDWEVQSEFYAYADCTQKDSDKLKHLAIWIAPNIPNKEIVSLISQIQCKLYPAKWAEYFLRDQLGLTQDEIEDIVWED